MEIRSKNEALDAANGLETYLKESLEAAKSQVSAIESQLERWRDMVSRYEKSIESIGAIREIAEQGLPAVPMASVPNANLNAVVSILRTAFGGPLRAKEIAEQAFEKKLIFSSGGASGVEAIVRNTLSRNPHVFVNSGWGWWDLIERRTPPVREASSEAAS